MSDDPGNFSLSENHKDRERRIVRSNQVIFNIAKALPRFRDLDDRLEFIIREVHNLLEVEGASIILLDEDKQEFFFRAVSYDDTEAGRKIKGIRFPADKGVAGYVYKTGKPLIVLDTSRSEFFFDKVDEQSDYKTRNMLDVPIHTDTRMIGALCMVNKKNREFDQTDIEVLIAIASTVAFPIENARISEELRRSYDEVKSLNQAKERVIHHLSHELKTPVSVLAASLNLLNKKISVLTDDLQTQDFQRILERAQRNLNRILEMQYKIEDILREKDYKTCYMLSALLDVCTEALEIFTESYFSDYPAQNLIQDMRNQIKASFGPREEVSIKIDLSSFAEKKIHDIRPLFSHRSCSLEYRAESSESEIFIPLEILNKITEGLIKNAVENTPDGGEIFVTVRNGKEGPEFEVKDFGVGITENNKRLIFESNFTTRATSQYSSKKPYDFNAGGKGFDLLRIKIFSERYNFHIKMISERCRFIPGDEDICPGKTESCKYCRSIEDCLNSGGTTVIIQFQPFHHEHGNRNK